MSMIAFWTGAAGMNAYQAKLDVTGHNIANVQTNGYKARRVAFEDLLYSRINTNVEGNHLVGHGSRAAYIDQIMLQQGLDNTGYPLDFALVGDGFFAVDNEGRTEYTRNGAFDISVAGNTGTLVTNDGAYVLDRNGQRITLEQTENGTFDTADLKDRLGVYTFPNQWGLNPENGARYTISDNSGQPVLTIPGENPDQPLDLRVGYLENSGVDLGNEMIDMIMAQRAFQINSRVLQTADQIAENVNNLR